MEGQNTLTGSGSVPSAPYANNPLDIYKAKAPVVTSGNVASYQPYTTSPCPSCGHCPTCGRSNGWTSGPQWTWTAPMTVASGGYPSAGSGPGAASANGF